MALEELKNKEYDEVWNYPGLILVGLGGSHSYGTNIATSDIDLRGIFLNSPDELIGISKDREQKVFGQTDTVLYSLRKFAKLAADCNPNVIEMLGLRRQDYVKITNIGEKLVKNRHLFLSKRAVYTFGGYAKSQLNRLINKKGRTQDDLDDMECRSIQKLMDGFAFRYKDVLSDDFSAELNENNEIICNMTFHGMELSRIIGMNNELINVDKDYRKSTRNDKAEAHGKIAKHMMHLLRLYMMGIDILNVGEINTYRYDEHDLLMAIRNGEFLEEDGCTPTKEFNILLDYYSAEFEIAAKNTLLPDEPDWGGINRLLMEINRNVLLGEVVS